MDFWSVIAKILLNASGYGLLLVLLISFLRTNHGARFICYLGEQFSKTVASRITKVESRVDEIEHRVKELENADNNIKGDVRANRYAFENIKETVKNIDDKINILISKL